MNSVQDRVRHHEKLPSRASRHLGEGYSSLFSFCTQALHLSEHAVYGRIEAARAARRFPAILERLDSGELTLTSVCLLRPHLTNLNHVAVLGEASCKTKRDVEQIVARLAPKPDVLAAVRTLPMPIPSSTTRKAAPLLAASETTGDVKSGISAALTPTVPAPSATAPKVSRPEITPLAPQRFKLQLTIGGETLDKLRRVQSLLRHSVADGNLETIIDRAVTLLLEEVQRTRFGFPKPPREGPTSTSHTRYIRLPIKRAVWARDEGRCAFVGTSGRCTETAFLEFHHVTPYAQGGTTTEDNLELRCRAHNAYEETRRFAELPRASDV